MSPETTAQFMAALKCAFGMGPVRPAAAPSPFTVKTEEGPSSAAPGTPAVSPATGCFTAGGSFASQGASAFPVGSSQEALAAAAKQAAVELEALTQRWERSRDEGLASLKAKIAVQRLKLGTVAGALVTAQEVAKKAQEAGGGIEETKQAAEMEAEGRTVQDLIDTMEEQRLGMESEAFSKAGPQKAARASPF